MRRLSSTLVNILFFIAVSFVAVTVTTIAFTKRVNDAQMQNSNNITATVVKEVVPVLAMSSGVVKTIHVRVGQKVRKNDLLIELDNPVLEGKIKALQNYPDNISAQTEASVAEEELKQLRIYAPVDGVVNDILTSEGSPVEPLGKLIDLYSNEHILLLAHVTNDQYQTLQHSQSSYAYSQRLNQNFTIVSDILQPDMSYDNTTYQKAIGLYFSFKDPVEAQSLLNNEDLSLQLQTHDQKVLKPIDYIVRFWNNILISKQYAKE